MVVGVRGEYDLVYKDYTPVVGQSRYRLPARMYDGVRDVCWVDTDGREWLMTSIDLEDVPRLQNIGNAPTARECQFYLDGDYLRLHPAPGAVTGTLRVKYVLHPSKLVKTTSANVIDITGAGYGVNVEGFTAWNISGTSQYNPDNGAISDVVAAGNSHSCLLYDAAVESGLGIYAAAWPYDPLVSAGDYLCAAGYTPIVQLPDAALSYFVLRVAALCLDAADDAEGSARLMQHTNAARQNALAALKPRNQAEPRTLVCRNSALRVGWSVRY